MKYLFTRIIIIVLMKLTKNLLIKEAEYFCARANSIDHPELLGINDGKTIGTYIEHEFKKHLLNKYDFKLGSSSMGVDFPDEDINTDLKVTSLNKPQNSCPFLDIRQKIYGLGYNLLLFLYEKNEKEGKCYLFFDSCTFIDADETGDYKLTSNLRKMLQNKWSKEKIVYYLEQCKLPGDKTTLNNLAEEIIENPPKQGYLTVSNAFQWRIKYTYTNKNTNLPVVDVKKEFGDFQTPLYFARQVFEYILERHVLHPDLIIEPTCGIGNFIQASHSYYPNTPVIGIDVNESYLKEVCMNLPDVMLYNVNVFDFDFNKVLSNDYDEYLLVGNPPWVTNTRLSKYDSNNIPQKENIKNLNFFDATTGSSNFDISENILLHLIKTFKNTTATFIFLCKFQIACNIFEYLIKGNIQLSEMEIIRFDSLEIFNADTSSCILFIQFNENNKLLDFCNVYNFDGSIHSRMGIVNGQFYSNLDNVVDIDGECCFEWRQGIKHDCTKIMELSCDGDKYKNKNEDVVLLEDDLLYPLLKSSDIKIPMVTSSDRRTIITQHKLKEDTSYIKEKYPSTWQYLERNEDYFLKRKSNIYHNAPKYSIFGIGEYTFKKCKVAISGFYKEGLFSLVYNEKPMMLDDTCYYLSFDNYETAYITMLVLNTWIVKSYLKSIVILDSKRPYTKKVLKRIDIKKAIKLITLNTLIETEKNLKLKKYINQEKWDNYTKLINKINTQK